MHQISAFISRRHTISRLDIAIVKMIKLISVQDQSVPSPAGGVAVFS